MVLRELDDGGVICIGQPSHAWVSGQLAQAWGNPRFPVPEPREEVCLAASQHDIGMAAWDAAPELNPDTGWPRSFMQMPVATHLELWTNAPRLARSQSRYAALLVSMHGTALYEMRDLEREPGQRAAAIRDYLTAQRALQDELVDSLRADPAYAPYAGEENVRRNQRLLFTWDWMSLVLCLDRLPETARRVPAADGEATLALRPREDGAVMVEPWPFAVPALTVRCDGRRLRERLADESELHTALEHADWTTLDFQLVAQSAA